MGKREPVDIKTCYKTILEKVLQDLKLLYTAEQYYDLEIFKLQNNLKQLLDKRIVHKAITYTESKQSLFFL